MADDRGSEYWRIIPHRGGKRYRKERDEALDAIEDAIDRGDMPGEV